jgi:hypothetical protein
MKKIIEKFMYSNKEYVLLFGVICILGLMIYANTAVSQTGQDITVTSFHPAPFVMYNRLEASRMFDYDNTAMSINPSHESQIRSLKVTRSITTETVGSGSYIFDLGTGNANLNEVEAVRFYQGDAGPFGTDAQRGGGKYIYGTADIAEGIITSGCEPGDVVIISDDENFDVIKSTVRFDARVAGIVSEEPKIYMGSHEKKAPLALAGIVKCKASNENGNIKRGDLLVTASISGHAMRADAYDVKPGMLVGKAMQPLNDSTGKIYVLVNKK